MAKRTVLITGGAGGIGAALTAAFAAAGDEVVIADLDPARLAAVPEPARTVVLDVTDPDSIARALGELERVDVLVNNAGLLDRHGPLLELPVADLDATFSVNVRGTFLMTQLTARRMVADEVAAGAIVNISSIGGRQPTFGMGAYEASKAAVDSLTRWAALELAQHGIRVNAVAPGPVLTPALAAAMPSGSAARTAWTERIPLGDFAGIDDVARAAVYLAGDGAAHITGISLPVDGGQLLT